VIKSVIILCCLILLLIMVGKSVETACCKNIKNALSFHLQHRLEAYMFCQFHSLQMFVAFADDIFSG
jgi:hypothetical protein